MNGLLNAILKADVNTKKIFDTAIIKPATSGICLTGCHFWIHSEKRLGFTNTTGNNRGEVSFTV